MASFSALSKICLGSIDSAENKAAGRCKLATRTQRERNAKVEAIDKEQIKLIFGWRRLDTSVEADIRISFSEKFMIPKDIFVDA